MQRLTAMTLGAAFIGFCGYLFDASATAQTPAPCATHEATVYFAPDSSSLNEYADYALDRMAEAARACGAKGVIVQVSSEGDRAKAVANALRGRGVKAVIQPVPTLAISGDTMVARAVTLHVATPTSSVG